MTTIVTARVHHHIDNGGLTFELGHEYHDGIAIPYIIMTTDYFGYPSVISKMIGSNIPPEFLRKVAMGFERFALDIEERQKESE